MGGPKFDVLLRLAALKEQCLVTLEPFHHPNDPPEAERWRVRVEHPRDASAPPMMFEAKATIDALDRATDAAAAAGWFEYLP